MAMRITTNGIFNGYRKDLAGAYGRFSKSMSQVTTQRKFESYAEDVSAASRAFQTRRSHWRAENQITNSNYVISKFETAWSAIDYIVDGEGMEDNLNGIVESLRGLNSPTGSARNALGQSAIAKAESIVRLLNTQYGDQFIFAGKDGRNVPFAWGTDDAGKIWLTYRGIDVSTPVGMTEDELKDHIVVKHNPEETVTEVTDEMVLSPEALQGLADQIGQDRYPAETPFKLEYDSDSDTFTLTTALGTYPLDKKDVLEALRYPTDDVAGEFQTTKYEYSFAQDEDGNLTLTQTTTTEKEENWEVTFDDALTAQGYTLETLEGGKRYRDPTEAETALNDIDMTQEFDNYKKQFNGKYVDFAHGDDSVDVYENGRKLYEMSRETTYVDIGIGVAWYDQDEDVRIPDLIPTSAYNSALNGLSFLGFGSELGEDGELHSNNLAVLMMEMGTMLEDCDSVTGRFPEGWDTEKVAALTRKIERSVNDVTVQHVKLANDTRYLQTNLTQLTAQRDNLNNQILAIEQVDPADAITEYMYARYAYNAALSVGSTILTNSLLDYLR